MCHGPVFAGVSFDMFTLCVSCLAIFCLYCMAEPPFCVASKALQVSRLAERVTCEVADCLYVYRHLSRNLEMLTTLRQMALCQSQR